MLFILHFKNSNIMQCYDSVTKINIHFKMQNILAYKNLDTLEKCAQTVPLTKF